MYDDEAPQKQKAKKHGRWGPLDIFLGLGSIVILIALTIAAFKIARWVWDMYF